MQVDGDAELGANHGTTGTTASSKGRSTRTCSGASYLVGQLNEAATANLGYVWSKEYMNKGEPFDFEGDALNDVDEHEDDLSWVLEECTHAAMRELENLDDGDVLGDYCRGGVGES